MGQAQNAVAAANETANATATAVDQAQNALVLLQMKRLMQLQQQSIKHKMLWHNAANETANATATASNQTGNPVLDALKNIFGGITGNN